MTNLRREEKIDDAENVIRMGKVNIHGLEGEVVFGVRCVRGGDLRERHGKG